MSKRTFVVLVLGLLMVHLALASWAPPASDELYYWCWSKELQLSYFDHGPLTAYLIRLSTLVFGDSVFALRLPACLCTCAMLLLLVRLTRPLTPLGWVVLSPPCFLFAVVMTPDAPLQCFWTAYVVWLAGLHERLAKEGHVSWPSWLAGGLLLGLGILSKYTMGLAGISAALSLVGIRPWRKWFLGFLVHGAVGFAVSSPILLYNLQENFVPLQFQWVHVIEGDSPTIRFLPEFIGGQFLAVGMLPLFLTPWLIWRRRTLSADPRLRACLFVFLVPYLFFLYKAARGHLEINWPIMAYSAFWPLAAHWFEHVRSRPALRRFGLAGFVAPVAVTVALTWHLFSPFSFVPPRRDLVTRCGSCYSLSRQVGQAMAKLGPDKPVFAPNHQLTSYLRFQNLRAEQIPGITRTSHFTQKPFPWNDPPSVFVLWEGVPPNEYFPGFEFAEVVAEFPFVIRGQETTHYWLSRYVHKQQHQESANDDHSPRTTNHRGTETQKKEKSEENQINGALTEPCDWR
jgi:hypothetical protein